MNTFELPILGDAHLDDVGSQEVFGGLESPVPASLQPFGDEPGSAEALPTLRACQQALERCAHTGEGTVVPLVGLSPAASTFLRATLGEGEVTVNVGGGHHYDSRETVLPGLWRVETRALTGELLSTHLEVGPVPRVALAANGTATLSELSIGQPPQGAMNVVPVLAELRHRSQSWRRGQPNHVFSFTLLPMTEADMAFLEAQLGHGPVRGESRGFSRCRVELTAVRNVWSVQHFNALGKLILDTLEVGAVPTALAAGGHDFEDSAVRLGEWLTEAPS
jgi:hydrogenase-1 operon protein HyaF